MISMASAPHDTDRTWHASRRAREHHDSEIRALRQQPGVPTGAGSSINLDNGLNRAKGGRCQQETHPPVSSTRGRPATAMEILIQNRSTQQSRATKTCPPSGDVPQSFV